MSENKSIPKNINELVEKVMKQTTYSTEEALNKLIEFNYDIINVIKDYMGIKISKPSENVKSINQEIYKQIRYTLDSSMKTYRDNNPLNIDQVIQNLQESEEKEKLKNR